MADLGPRACTTCGPTIEGCYRCHATTGHRHVTVVNRRGAVVGSLAACDLHAIDLASASPDAARVVQEIARGRERKRSYDRARRAAIRDVLDAHPEAYRQALDRRTREVGR